ncbi:putative RNA-directed DNA polymerase, eukaryota, reverse transcriptase zinc-binding domain protein [Tanacetum coccineum]
MIKTTSQDSKTAFVPPHSTRSTDDPDPYAKNILFLDGVHCLGSCKTSRVEVLRRPHIRSAGRVLVNQLRREKDPIRASKGRPSNRRGWYVIKILQLNHQECEVNKQRSRVRWAIDGDENSRYFHASLKKNLAKHNIHGISYVGVWVNDANTVKQEVFTYFANRFKEERRRRPKFQSIFFQRLSPADIELLESDFTMEEIKDATWSCEGSKSPGLDGLNFNFIKRYWDLLKRDFFNCFKHFESTRKLAKGCNPSFITLVPKIRDPIEISDFRPISLIGCVYKILSKLLAIRLAKVMDKIIRPNQTAFIAGRQILDGILVANEIINYACAENIRMLLFKVDFEKAFYSVNWEFLFDTMNQMGFGRDPLSPFLFLIVAEALQVTILEACNNNIYKVISLNEDGSNISLLQYADDALFFGEWSVSNAYILIQILKCFQEASSLKVNLVKSIIYGIGVLPVKVASLAYLIHCGYDTLPFKYLGLPVGMDLSKCSSWFDVIDSFTKRISSWKSKC